MKTQLFSLAALVSIASANPCPGFTLARPPFEATCTANIASCANANWPPPGPGKHTGSVLVPQMPDKALQAALREVDVARIKANIAKLVSFGTRHTLSSQNDTKRGIGAARTWLFEEMSRYSDDSGGRLKVETPGYLQGPAARVVEPTWVSNVVGTLDGEEDPTRLYVTMGHYDSRVTDFMNWWDDSPGANDDASGVAVILEMARIMSKYKHRATLVFGAMAGEEQGLLGSGFMAQTYRNASANIEGVLNFDIVGSSRGSRGEKDPNTVRVFCQGLPPTEDEETAALRLASGLENDSPARNMGRFVAEVAGNKYTDMKIAMVYRLDRFERGGDHRSFLQAGYDSSIRFTEPNENYDHQHQDTRVEKGTQYGDLEKFLDYEYIKRVAKVDLVSLWSLANAPGQPQNVTMVVPPKSEPNNDTILKWAKLADPKVKGYEVVWRPTTAPQWTHAAFLGKATQVAIGLTRDNVIFGIRSVGTNGYKSPAAMPLPVSTTG